MKIENYEKVEKLQEKLKDYKKMVEIIENDLKYYYWFSPKSFTILQRKPNYKKKDVAFSLGKGYWESMITIYGSLKEEKDMGMHKIVYLNYKDADSERVMNKIYVSVRDVLKEEIARIEKEIETL